MHDQDLETKPTTEPNGGLPATDVDSEHDPLLGPLERWEERYRQGEDASPESLGVDDSALMRALRDRIDRQKRLYMFLGLSSASEMTDDGSDHGDTAVGPAAPQKPPVDEGRERDPTRACPGAEPPAIGRYRVIR